MLDAPPPPWQPPGSAGYPVSLGTKLSTQRAVDLELHAMEFPPGICHLCGKNVDSSFHRQMCNKKNIKRLSGASAGLQELLDGRVTSKAPVADKNTPPSGSFHSRPTTSCGNRSKVLTPSTLPMSKIESIRTPTRPGTSLSGQRRNLPSTKDPVFISLSRSYGHYH